MLFTIDFQTIAIINNENLPHNHQQQYPRRPTTGFVLTRTHQAGIVAKNCC